MYHWIEDKQFLGRMRGLCSGIVNQLVQAINNDGALFVRQHLVGSGAKNLITQNANQPIDLDYNLEIVECSAGWNNCQDSTSALTAGTYHFIDGVQTGFSIDLCIVRKGSYGRWERLIHEKVGYTWLDRYFWNEARQSNGLEDRIQWLKENDCWLEVRETYLEKKNMYLSRGDRDHPSFIVYIEAVNEVFNKYR